MLLLSLPQGSREGLFVVDLQPTVAEESEVVVGSVSMTEVSIEAAHGPMDSFLLNSWLGFKAFPSAALSIVFVSECVRVYAPAIFQGMAFILTLIPVPRFWREDYEVEGASSSDLSQDPVIIPDKYTTFHDDRKAKKGGDKDFYMLKNHGFDKYRHLSDAFIKRNLQPAAPRAVTMEKSVKKRKGSKSKKKMQGKE